MPKKYLFDVSTYHHVAESGVWPENLRIELLEGEIVEMSPIGSAHAAIVTALDDLFHESLSGLTVIRVQNPVQLGDLSEPQPDLALVKSSAHRYRASHPTAEDVLLIVEVSDSRLEYDRSTKLLLYARYRIPEVWVIDVKQVRLNVFREPTPNGYQQRLWLTPDDMITPVSFPNVSIALTHIF